MAPVTVITSTNTGAPDTVARRIFEALPNVELEVASFVPLGERAIPYVWVWGDDLDRFESTAGEYPEVAAIKQLERIDGGALYRIDWDIDSPLIQCINRSNATLVKAHGTAERWKLTVWFESAADAPELLACCNDLGVPIEVDQFHSIADERVRDRGVVTPRQKEALTTAYDHGYFERPRDITQTELAELLDISASAAGDRLRRGTANIVEHRWIE